VISRFAFFPALLAIAFIGQGAASAEEPRVRCFGDKNDDCRVFFDEPTVITHLIAMQLEHLVASGKRLSFLNIRNSPGGDVYAAMRIGRLLRAQSGRFNTMKCASACVFVAVGAVERPEPWEGLYGLHRPYGTRPTNSPVEAQEKFLKTNADIASYLREMNVQPSLLGAMNVVPPQSIRWLTSEEATAFGLTSIDPAYEEFLQGQAARKLGISRQELLARLQRREVECDPIDEFSPARTECLRRIGLLPRDSKRK